jgi:prepilin peptidase CpaA
MAESSGIIASLPACVFALLMIAAGVGDAMTRRIPNWLTGVIAVAFFPLALGSGMGVASIAQHLVVGAALLLAGFLLFSFGLFGGGDAKLMAAAGLWFGYPNALPFLMYTALAGGVLAVAIGLLFLVRWHAEIRGLWPGLPRGKLKPDVPYGIALAAGAIFASPGAWWMAAGG